jgi:hypothetical protein
MAERVFNGSEENMRKELERLKLELGILPEPKPLDERPTARAFGMDIGLMTGIPPEMIRQLNETTAANHETKKVLDAEWGGDPALQQKARRYRELKEFLNPPKGK